MNSTESSGASSATEPGRGARPDIYQGAEYRAATGPAGLPLDPYVHDRPFEPDWVYRLVLALVRIVARVLFRFHVDGQENIPPPPFIIASNHQAWFDTLFIAAAFPRLPMIYTMAKRETVFDRGWKRWIVRRLGVFPISPRQGVLDAQAIATVYRILSLGGVVLIFPEGRYSRGRELRPLKKGVAHFALQAGVPISPVAISGVDRLRPFGRVTVSIGPAINPDPPRWWDLNRRVVRVVDSVRRGILKAFAGSKERRADRLRDRLQLRLGTLVRRRVP